jgi:ATP-dependent protease ClpP protease subunit
MPDRKPAMYRYRGSVEPSAQVKRPVAVHRAPRAEAAAGGSSSASSATIDIFDVIDSYGGWWGISAGEVDAALKQVGDVDTLYVRLNSPGGEATEGVAIANLLRANRATVRVTVYGLAASAASMVAVAGEVVNMAPGSILMIHDAWDFAVGPADDFRKAADVLDTISDSYAGLYAAKAGGDAATWRAVMREDKWYSADAAVEAKLADTVGIDATLPADLPPVEDDPASDAATVIELDIEINPAARAAARRFDLSLLPNAPAALVHPQTPAEPPDVPTEEGADTMSDTLNQALRERLGVTDEGIDENGLIAALDEALAEAPEPAPAAAATLPEGLVAIEATVLDELRGQASAGAQARAQQVKEHREQLVKAAVDDGRIAPARRDHWLAQLEADPGAETVLTNLAPGLVPVAEIGHGGPANDNNVFTDDEAGALAQLAGVTKEGLLR